MATPPASLGMGLSMASTVVERVTRHAATHAERKMPCMAAVFLPANHNFCNMVMYDNVQPIASLR